MRIAHVSDVHIRNLKYHDEYRRVFDDFYDKLLKLDVDLVVNTGDTAHTKTQISPEFVQMTSDHLKRVSEICPYHIILGNHDLNLMNPDRQDALMPIVKSINSSQIHFHKKSGARTAIGKRDGIVTFWVFSLADRENYPTRADWERFPGDINIGLFHGSISSAITDTNWRMVNAEHDLEIFDGLDFVMMGDIHKQQFFRDRKIAYAGSMIQQNFGEEIEKGFLLWDIKGKDEFSVTSIPLRGSRKFYTVKLNEDLSIPDVQIDPGSRIRISPSRQITLVEQKEIEKRIKKQFVPHDVMTLLATNIGMQQADVGKRLVDVENLRQLSVQEKLVRDFFEERKIEPEVLTRVLEIDRKLQVHLDQKEDIVRNVSWRINKVLWSNMFNYGEENFVDFSSLGGLTGIFAPNGSGKSNLIDVLLETLFDSTTKGTSKNIHLINDNKEIASAVAHITANDQDYLIDRKIERIKYGQRTRDQLKEWGRTNVTFGLADDQGIVEKMVGTTRPETEKSIRQRLGTFDDFLLTSLIAQWNPFDIIACKETERKKILYKFLDLEMFEQKSLLAKEDGRQHSDELELFNDPGIEARAGQIKDRRGEIAHEISALNKLQESTVDRVSSLDRRIELLLGEKFKTRELSLDDWQDRIDRIKRDLEKNGLLREDIVKKISDLEGRVESSDPFDKKELEAERREKESIASHLSRLGEKIAKLESEIARAKNDVTILGEVPCGDKFPTCRFLVGAFESSKRLPIVESLLKDEKRVHEELQRDARGTLDRLMVLEQRERAAREFEFLSSTREKLKLQEENVQLRIDGLLSELKLLEGEHDLFEESQKQISHNQRIDREVDALRREREAEERSLRDGTKRLSFLAAEDSSLENELSGLSGKLERIRELQRTCQAYELYAEAMGKDGIPYTILTQRLPSINEEINKILGNAVDFSVFIEHDPEEQSIRFFLQYGEYRRRLLELGSGAEKFIASIAIRSALLSISNLPKTNIFIIDEGFGKLDPSKLESVQLMFDYLKTAFDHVIVISHLDTMKDMVDNIIEITSDPEGYAHVEVGGSDALAL